MVPNARKTAPFDVASLIGWGVRSAAVIVPRASCLTQALAAQFMLARLGYETDIRVGVRQDATGRIGAHAWLLSDGKVILGGNPAELRLYSPLVDLSPGAP